jgi:hypothetical protein
MKKEKKLSPATRHPTPATCHQTSVPLSSVLSPPTSDF